jgi:hypothetical protein
MRQARITERRPAGRGHEVLSVEGGEALYRRTPCGGCPWRQDRVGTFPAAAFRHSANTSYDASIHTFACHESRVVRPAWCAGFLLKNADHNLAVRLKEYLGKIDMCEIRDGGHALFESYRAMAIANGVDPVDPVLRRCRANRQGP